RQINADVRRDKEISQSWAKPGQRPGLQFAEFLDHFRREPQIAPPDLDELSVTTDEGGGEAVRQGAALGLDENREALGERVDLGRIAGHKIPNGEISL